MHARPRFFAKCMGELLFWVGEDKMMFGSDYAIWEPKWQIEGLVDWDYPDDTYSDFPRWTTAAKKKVLGLNAARLYDVEVPEELQLAEGEGHARRRRRRAARRGRGVITQARVLAALATVHDPELDEPITSLGFVGSCVVGRRRRRRRAPAPADAAVRAELRVPHGIRRARGRAPGDGGARGSASCSTTTTPPTRSTPRSARTRGFGAAFPGESAGDLEALRELFARKALLARQGRVAAMLLPGAGSGRAAGTAADHAAVVALCVADLPPDHPEVARCLVLRRELGLPCGPAAPALVAGDGSRLTAEELPLWLRRARLVGLSLESNGGLCRSLLRVRHGVPDPTEEVAT